MADTAENATPAAERKEVPPAPEERPEAAPSVADGRAMRWGVIVVAAVLVAAVAAGVTLHGRGGEQRSTASTAKAGAPASGSTAADVYTAPTGSAESSTTSGTATSTTTGDPGSATSGKTSGGAGSAKGSVKSAGSATGDAVLTKSEQRTVAQKHDALLKAMDAAYQAINFSSRGDALSSKQWADMEQALRETHDAAAELRQTAQAAGGDAGKRKALVAALADLEDASAKTADVARKHGDVWSARYSTGLADCREAVPSAYAYYVRG